MSEGMCAAAYGNIDSPLRAKLCCLYDRVYNLQPDRINIGANIESRGGPKFSEKKNLFSNNCPVLFVPYAKGQRRVRGSKGNTLHIFRRINTVNGE